MWRRMQSEEGIWIGGADERTRLPVRQGDTMREPEKTGRLAQEREIPLPVESAGQ